MDFTVNLNNEIISFSTKISTKFGKIKLKSSSNNKGKLFLNFDKILVTDVFSISDKFLSIKRKIEIKEMASYKISFEVQFKLIEPEVFIPCVMYKKNGDGKGSFPIIDKIKYWSFDESRMSIPGCIELYKGRKVLIAGHRANKEHISTSWNNDCISFNLPSIEGPFVYLGKNKLAKKDQNEFIELEKGQIIDQEYLIYFDNLSENSNSIFYKYLEYSKQFIKNNHELTLSLKKADYKALLLRQLLFLLESSEKGYYLKMGKGNGIYQNIYNYTSASFLVKSIEAALIFYSMDTEKLKLETSPKIISILEKQEQKSLNEKTYKEMSISIADYFLHAEAKKGVFRDCYSLDENIWGGYLGIGENDEFRYNVNARTNGEAMLAYLQLCDYLDEEHKQGYLKLIHNVVNFYLVHQLENGNYGRWWTEKGQSVSEKGTNGAYILILMAELYKREKNDKILASITKAAGYYAQLVEGGKFFGDTLDAESCDKEAGHALLRGFLSLYEIEAFQTPYYLKLCKDCANFIVTWIQLDNIHFDSFTPLGIRKFKTKGLTSVSIANQHLDCYGMMIGYDFLRLSRYSDEKFYKVLALEMIKSCQSLISKPEDKLGKGEDFYGWIPEQINHTNWDYFGNEDKAAGYFSINIAWVHVLVLGYFNKIDKDFPEVIK